QEVVRLRKVTGRRAVVVEYLLSVHAGAPVLQLAVNALIDVGFTRGRINGKDLGHVGLIGGVIRVAPVGKERADSTAAEFVLKIGTGVGAVGAEGLGELDAQSPAFSSFFGRDQDHAVDGARPVKR